MTFCLIRYLITQRLPCMVQAATYSCGKCFVAAPIRSRWTQTMPVSRALGTQQRSLLWRGINIIQCSIMRWNRIYSTVDVLYRYCKCPFMNTYVDPDQLLLLLSRSSLTMTPVKEIWIMSLSHVCAPSTQMIARSFLWRSVPVVRSSRELFIIKVID